jgi:hypothetical protein
MTGSLLRRRDNVTLAASAYFCIDQQTKIRLAANLL